VIVCLYLSISCTAPSLCLEHFFKSVKAHLHTYSTLITHWVWLAAAQIKYRLIIRYILLPICFVTVITCAVLPAQAHGTKTCTGKGYEYNDQCNFTCDVGYERKGSSVRVCQADGQWSGTATTCEGIQEYFCMQLYHFFPFLLRFLSHREGIEDFHFHCCHPSLI